MKNKIKIIISCCAILISINSFAQNNKPTYKVNSTYSNKKNDPSENMKNFLNMFNGKVSGVEAGISKYGKEGLDIKQLNLYNPKDPIITSQVNNGANEKYDIDVVTGNTVRKYTIAWERNKISKIIDKGSKK